MQSKVIHNSVQIIFFPDKINIMQYLYLLNVSFSIFQACCCTETSHANYEHKSRNYLII